MKSKVVFIFSLFITSLFSPSNLFSDTVYCCQTDTLKLAYMFEGSLYNDECDIQIGDVVVINSTDNIFVLVEPAVSTFDFIFWQELDPLCEFTLYEFENHITEIKNDGYFVGNNFEQT